jgi:probable HAF family extracellular repeat protein
MASASQQYGVKDIGLPSGASVIDPVAINNLGDVVGSSSDGTNSAGFAYAHGVFVDLGGHFPADINDHGQVVGRFTNASGYLDAFEYSKGSFMTIGPTNASTSAASINNAGQVVGETWNLQGFSGYRLFSYSAGTLTDLGLPAGMDNFYANHVNEGGQIIGTGDLYGDPRFDTAFVYSGTGFNDVSAPGTGQDMGIAMNDGGQVAVVGNVSFHMDGHTFTGSGAAYADIGRLGGTNTFASSINNAGQIVGTSETSAYGVYHAFLYNPKTGLTDLTATVPLPNGALVDSAVDINNTGQILVSASNGRAYILTPVPEPTEYQLLVAGLVVAGVLSAMTSDRRHREGPRRRVAKFASRCPA